jgi:uncharacterized membrane protein
VAEAFRVATAALPDFPVVLRYGGEDDGAVDVHLTDVWSVPAALNLGALVGAAIADVAYLRTKDRFWARSARYLTNAGALTAAIAALPGAVDFTTTRAVRRTPIAWIHAAGNASVLGLALVSSALRGRNERSAAAGPALAISMASAGLLLVTGWLGGELSYRHRIGVTTS